ncbi:colanic acid biosynthesis glycosyltransferase WcaL [Psychroserpens burtonensis]|uniref:Colanic acid biosynthesis glycosyltransferase WcaL n=1 Tax=Psychroserpens burtonensis TaxID=49278 RepID=A0A5C7B6S8_9FLAO|nr:glycosyltransferase [Psychroserpens burtonensis]TXE17123.1 colanic acid biosynthesis glycosyltransferase WcaL [Psychroserpens burtonensis]
MKTICFVVPKFPSVSETFVTNQIIVAKKQGYSVCVLTYKLGNLEQSSQRDLFEKYEILKDTIAIDYKIPKTKRKQLGVGLFLIIRYFKYWIKPVNVSLKHRVLNWPFLLKFYEKFKHVDVFHVQFALGGKAIAEMKENGLLKAKLITTFHGHDAHFQNKNVLQHLQNTYRVLFKMSNYVTVNTPFLEAQVLELGCKQETLKVVSMAIDVAYFKSDSIKELPNQADVKLISVGRLIEMKGFEYAIKAVKILVDEGINTHYTIIGEGELYKSLEDQIQVLELTNHVTLVGKKSQEEIRSALQSHHIYLMSSVTNAKGRCETQGVVTAEAQAMGLPVVAFNNGGIPYTIREDETGILLPEKDVEAYAAAILEILESPEIFQRMSRQARDFAVTNFSNQLMSERFSTLYEN